MNEQELREEVISIIETREQLQERLQKLKEEQERLVKKILNLEGDIE